MRSLRHLWVAKIRNQKLFIEASKHADRTKTVSSSAEDEFVRISPRGSQDQDSDPPVFVTCDVIILQTDNDTPTVKGLKGPF